MKIGRFLVVLFTLLLMPVMLNATPLTIEFLDPSQDVYIGEDGLPGIDVLKTLLYFDNETGDYSITLNSTDSNPFLGYFRVNIVFLNGDVDPEYNLFNDNLNDYYFDAAATEITLTGNSDILTYWGLGDSIIASALNQFNSHVFSSSNTEYESGKGSWDAISSIMQVSTVQAAPVPEPSTIVLMGLGLVGLAGYGRKRMRQ